MIKQISNFLERFTTFMNNDKALLGSLTASIVAGSVAAAGLVASSHKALSEFSAEAARQASPMMTSVVENLAQNQLLDMSSVSAGVAAATLLVVAAGKILKTPAENLSRTFGDNSIFGVNDHVNKLVAAGKNTEASSYIKQAFEREHEGKKYLLDQYLSVIDKAPDKVMSIQALLESQKAPQLQASMNLAR